MVIREKFECPVCSSTNTTTRFEYNRSLNRYQKITECFNKYCVASKLYHEQEDIKRVKTEKNSTDGFFDNLIKNKNEGNVE